MKPTKRKTTPQAATYHCLDCGKTGKKTSFIVSDLGGVGGWHRGSNVSRTAVCYLMCPKCSGIKIKRKLVRK